MGPGADADLKPGAGGRILSGRSGGIGMLVINNPERRNALSLDMWQHAGEALEELAQDDNIRLLLVSGAGGKAFASGADISKFGEERTGPEAVRHYQAVSGAFYERLDTFPKPTLAQIAGFCIGGGLALALCCDMRICEEGARFALPAARLGIGYPPMAQKRLFDLVGPARGAEIMFTARQFNAAEALQFGLVNRVAPATDLDACVREFAGAIAENAPLTIATAKAVKIAIGRDALAAERDRLQAMVDNCYSSWDYAEGQRAFREKRGPKFTGR